MIRKYSSRIVSAQKIIVVSLFVVALLAFALAPNAQADSISYTLTVANPDLFSQGAGPYGTITVSNVGINGMVWLVSATGSNNFVFGATGTIALNVNLANAGTVTLQPFPFCTLTPCTQGGPGNNDGFGTFTFIVNDGPGFSNGGYPSVSFLFTTSNSVSSVSNLLMANDRGATVSAHMALASNTACTGFTADAGRNDASGPSQNPACVSTPEPSSLATGGIGMIGLLLLLGSRRLIKSL
jgi:ABC-type transport system substrate-binding protein